MKSDEPIDMTLEELEGFLHRVEPKCSPEDFAIICSLVETVSRLSTLLENKSLSIARLRALLFGQSSEKTRDVVDDTPKMEPGPDGSKPDKSRPKGHGRSPSSEYSGAERVVVAHQELAAKDTCPGCAKGRLYLLGEPARIIRVVGQPFLEATVWELERLRCNLCGQVYTAKLPAEAQGPRYDPTAAAMLSVLKYGSGLPFHRIEKHQQDLGVPVPASVAWEVVEKAAEEISPVHQALVEEAAQGRVLHNDDTNMKILRSAGAQVDQGEDAPGSKRTGTFTTGIISQSDEHRVALFYTGHKHAGENLTQVLRHRDARLAAPIQMCDALNRNEPSEFDTLLANCLAHGRRKFVEIATAFPAEVKLVLDALRTVYVNDAASRKLGLSPEERLSFHQTESAPVMQGLKAWLDEQFAGNKVEPNSTLGKAIAYLRNHWEPLTLFLRVAGAPLDNNVCERALKMAILHRKNSLFYKTEHGAAVGDRLMSLIHTCRLNGANPFDYLTELLKHRDECRRSPADWLPWRYKATLARSDPAASVATP